MRLFEFSSKPLVIIDVQSAYHSYFGDDYLYKVMKLIQNHNGPIINIFNTETAGETEQDVFSFYYENSLEFDIDEDVINNIKFIPKDFGFFRNWMDQNIPENIIIKTVRYMYQNKINDSREIPVDVLSQLMENYFDESLIDDMIYLPDIPVSQLKKYQNCYIIGGGRHECFKEMTLLFNVFNIRYTIIDSLVY